MTDDLDSNQIVNGGQSSSILCMHKESGAILALVENERLIGKKCEIHKSHDLGWWFLERMNDLGFSHNECIMLDNQGVTSQEMQELKAKYPDKSAFMLSFDIARQSGDHHLYHALSAYRQSGFQDCSILVMDGCDYPGGTATAIFSVDEKGKFTEVLRLGSNISLGSIYSYGCGISNFRWWDAGKLMGTSSYILPDMLPEIPPLFELKDNGLIKINAEFQTAFLEGNPFPFQYFNVKDQELLDVLSAIFPESVVKHWRNSKNNIEAHNKGEIKKFSFELIKKAAFFQKFFEATVSELVCYMRKRLPGNNLILTGGCALNCVMNGKIIRSGLWDRVFIPPMCDDAGNSVGAAIHRFGLKVNHPLVYNKKTYPVPVDYSQEISPSELARFIRKGIVIGWFEGGSEYGPRALCHRSLLANPELPYMSHRLNEIKGREYWRPLAPVVLDVYFQEFFKEARLQEPHRYMLATEYLKDQYRLKYPAIAAPDGSSRPQVLTCDSFQNETLYGIMIENKLPVLVNTSMNGRDQAICETPENARAFCEQFNDVLLVFINRGKIYARPETLAHIRTLVMA